jgi:hypothetical protein
VRQRCVTAETSSDIPSRSFFRISHAISKSEWPRSSVDLIAAMAEVARVAAATSLTIAFIIYFLREVAPSSRQFDRQFVPRMSARVVFELPRGRGFDS